MKSHKKLQRRRTGQDILVFLAGALIGYTPVLQTTMKKISFLIAAFLFIILSKHLRKNGSK